MSRKKVQSSQSDHESQIDVVYTWVDGASVDYRSLLGRYANRPIDTNPERYRDLYQMLRYSMRSIQQFVPWIGKIFVLTCRPQIPDWLNVNNPRVSVIHHDEIIDSEILPTFNSNVIESFLHRMPTSSERFIYLNDDFFFGAPTPFSLFYEAGRHLVRGTLFGERLPFRIYEKRNRIFSTGLVEHTPILVNKTHWKDMLDLHPKELAQTRSRKFRSGDDLMMDRLYAYYLLSRREIPTKAVPVWQTIRLSRFHKLTNNYDNQKKSLENLRRFRPNFLCLNDDQRDDPNPRVVKLVQEFLNEYYPIKSEFEK